MILALHERQDALHELPSMNGLSIVQLAALRKAVVASTIGNDKECDQVRFCLIEFFRCI